MYLFVGQRVFLDGIEKVFTRHTLLGKVFFVMRGHQELQGPCGRRTSHNGFPSVVGQSAPEIFNLRRDTEDDVEQRGSRCIALRLGTQLRQRSGPVFIAPDRSGGQGDKAINCSLRHPSIGANPGLESLDPVGDFDLERIAPERIGPVDCSYGRGAVPRRPPFRKLLGFSNQPMTEHMVPADMVWCGWRGYARHQFGGAKTVRSRLQHLASAALNPRFQLLDRTRYQLGDRSGPRPLKSLDHGGGTIVGNSVDRTLDSSFGSAKQEVARGPD